MIFARGSRRSALLALAPLLAVAVAFSAGDRRGATSATMMPAGSC